MDIINIICLSLSILPFLFGAYLIVSRLKLSCVNRSVLNHGNTVINSILLIFYSFSFFFVFKNNINFEYNFADIHFNGFGFDFGFLMNSQNMILIACAALCYLLISIYSNCYFEKKKQFLFTKQRYYAFLSLLAFNTYLFLLSKSMLQMLLFWILQGVIIFVYSFFDIFKNSVNFNITRFNRINLIGDFALLAGILILFKYSHILNFDSSQINLLETENIFKEFFANANIYEVWICFAAFILAVMTRLYIFPFNCYFSFFANSSDILYLCILSFANSVFGLYLFFTVLPFVEFFKYNQYFMIFFIISGVISLFLTVFERNIKIILGYFVSAISAFFLLGSLLFKGYLSAVIYFVLMILVTFAFMRFAYKGKLNIKPKFFTKKKGFLIERAHIFMFEKLPLKISKIVEIIDKFFVQNIILFFINVLDFFIKLFVVKIKSRDRFDYIRAIFLIFALILIFAIFIAFFGSGRYNGELIT